MSHQYLGRVQRAAGRPRLPPAARGVGGRWRKDGPGELVRASRWTRDPAESELQAECGPPVEGDGLPCALTTLGQRLVGLVDWPPDVDAARLYM